MFSDAVVVAPLLVAEAVLEGVEAAYWEPGHIVLVVVVVAGIAVLAVVVPVQEEPTET